MGKREGEKPFRGKVLSPSRSLFSKGFLRGFDRALTRLAQSRYSFIGADGADKSDESADATSKPRRNKSAALEGDFL